MFFSLAKLRRQFAISYLAQACLLLLVYFIAVPDSPYRVEVQGITYAASLWHQVSPVLVPLTLVFYGIQGLLILSALATLAERPLCRKDIAHYALTSIIYMVICLFGVVVLYMVMHPIASHYKMTGITEIPFVMSYGIWLTAVIIGIAYIAFVRLLTRIRYFAMDVPSLRPGTLFAGFRVTPQLSGVFLFVGIILAVWICPVALTAVGIVLQDSLVLGAALMATTLAYSYGTFLVVAVFWDRETRNRDTKKEEATPPPKRSKKSVKK